MTQHPCPRPRQSQVKCSTSACKCNEINYAAVILVLAFYSPLSLSSSMLLPLPMSLLATLPNFLKLLQQSTCRRGQWGRRGRGGGDGVPVPLTILSTSLTVSLLALALVLQCDSRSGRSLQLLQILDHFIINCSVYQAERCFQVNFGSKHCTITMYRSELHIDRKLKP